MDMSLTTPGVSVAGGGTRAGLFRTPISGGVQSATSAHGLPRPALAVRNLMEQVNAVCLLLGIIISDNFFHTYPSLGSTFYHIILAASSCFVVFNF